MNNKKVLVILGPTASGKTKLAVNLARKFKGEIISADSRQVFRGMDIGTGKDLKEYGKGKNKISYHLIDIVSPNEEFNLAKYQVLANKAIKKVIAAGHLPILVGGTGLYLQAIVDGYKLPPSEPDLKKRALLEKMSVPDLFNLLEKKKPEFAHQLNNSDKNNPRRLIRYLEIISQEKKTKGSKNKIDQKEIISKAEIKKLPYNLLILGLNRSDEEIRKLIGKRIKDRLENEDMVEEVERLNQEGVSWLRLDSFGLEYRFISAYLQAKIEYEEMIEKLGIATYRFAKRQKTWFRRWEKQGRKIEWLNKTKEAQNKVKKWLK
ncbi:MAG: tRNA (adenosine(37)-N6)-dimethylallyltransferase MiaA [Patescibacteria group bacterium]